MNNPQIDIIIDYMISLYPKGYKNLIKSYRELSKDNSNKRNLVTSDITGIWFDKLREWFYKRDDKYAELPKSADALTFSENRIILIEFKTGNQDHNEYKRKALLQNVSGKIIDSEAIIDTCIFGKNPDINQEDLELNFFLVIDANAMGVMPQIEAMIDLSAGSGILKEKRVEKMLTDLLGHFSEENYPNYRKIDIWYSTLFDFYLKVEKIDDMNSIITRRAQL